MSNTQTSAIFFGFSFRHHGPHTAFHGLKAELSKDQLVIDATTPWPAWTPHWLEWRLTWRWLRWSEWRLRPYYASHETRVIHYFFPENTMRKAHRWKGRHRLIATCHQPAENMRKRLAAGQDAAFFAGLRSCDHLVVQTRHDQEAYRGLFPGRPVHFVPLGVDTTFFNPALAAPVPWSEGTILTVGNWLRDYATWARVVRTLTLQHPDVRFTVIANPDTQLLIRRELGPGNWPVEFRNGISDEALRQEYARARLMFLPLQSAMANDALLEAMSMEIPVITSDLAATRDYLDRAGVFVRDNDVDTFADGILRLWNRRPDAREMGQAGRLRALQWYAWEKIADQYRTLYRST